MRAGAGESTPGSVLHRPPSRPPTPTADHTVQAPPRHLSSDNSLTGEPIITSFYRRGNPTTRDELLTRLVRGREGEGGEDTDTQQHMARPRHRGRPPSPPVFSPAPSGSPLLSTASLPPAKSLVSPFPAAALQAESSPTWSGETLARSRPLRPSLEQG